MKKEIEKSMALYELLMRNNYFIQWYYIYLKSFIHLFY